MQNVKMNRANPPGFPTTEKERRQKEKKRKFQGGTHTQLGNHCSSFCKEEGTGGGGRERSENQKKQECTYAPLKPELPHSDKSPKSGQEGRKSSSEWSPFPRKTASGRGGFGKKRMRSHRRTKTRRDERLPISVGKNFGRVLLRKRKSDCKTRK